MKIFDMIRRQTGVIIQVMPGFGDLFCVWLLNTKESVMLRIMAVMLVSTLAVLLLVFRKTQMKLRSLLLLLVAIVGSPFFG